MAGFPMAKVASRRGATNGATGYRLQQPTQQGPASTGLSDKEGKEMRKSLLLTAAAVLFTASAVMAAEHKVGVCHNDQETGEYVVINISQQAVPAHLAHHGDCIIDDGDACTEDSCDTVSGCVHTNTCDVCPCFAFLPEGWTATAATAISGIAICPDGTDTIFGTTFFTDESTAVVLSVSQNLNADCGGNDLYSCQVTDGGSAEISSDQYAACLAVPLP